jgi:hypothetical protein
MEQFGGEVLQPETAKTLTPDEAADCGEYRQAAGAADTFLSEAV